MLAGCPDAVRKSGTLATVIGHASPPLGVGGEIVAMTITTTPLSQEVKLLYKIS